ncbi:MAG TPA: AmmeMemoRadiSam system protein B [bacterium]
MSARACGSRRPVRGLAARTLLVSLIAGLACPMAAAAEAVRRAQVAGQFYPAGAGELREMVRGLLDAAPARASAPPVSILLVPHAGYRYSGPVAAAAYRTLEGASYDGVVVVGFQHRPSFQGVSVDAADAYSGPLGDIRVHREAVQRLMGGRSPDGSGPVRHVERAHTDGEHSLEVQLPFLQVALEDTPLVAVIIGDATLTDLESLADALADLAATGDYLFVFSTDLSHDRPHEDARRIDRRTIEAILSETGRANARLFAAGRSEACGAGPVVAALLLSARLGYLRPELLHAMNSGDTQGERARVVGYAAIAWSPRPDTAQPLVSDEAGTAMVRSARRAIVRALSEDPARGDPLPARLPELERAAGVFVTLTRHGALRGCIGRITTGEPLADSVPKVALEAAFKDSRFPPLVFEELDEMRIEVAVLTPLAPLQDPEDLVAGRDGVVLTHPRGSGVFLPSVWESTGWTRAEFLRELASQKAGLPPDAWRDGELFAFRTHAFEEHAP